MFLITAGFALYHLTTRDEAIRRRAMAFLADATAGEVSVGQAHFRMFGGITLSNVQVAVPFDEKLDTSAVDARARQIFTASSVTLIHNPWRLLFGTLRVDHIIAAQPKITLVHNVDTGMRNWQLLAGPRRMASRKGPPPRPRITIRSAKAVAVSVHSDGRHEARTEELDADIRPQPQSDTGFCIEVRRFSDPAERTTVVFDPGAKLVSNTPYVDARTVRLQLPKVAQQFFDQIKLEGEVKLGRLVYAGSTPENMDTEIELRHVRCAVPLSVLRSGQASSAPSIDFPAPASSAEESVFTLIDASGRVALTGGRLEIDVAGLFNGAKCIVKGKLFGVERPLAQIGMDVHFQGSKVPAPDGPARDQILADRAVPSALKAFFADYEPRGQFDVDLSLIRPVGPKGRIELRGHLKPLGASGKCRWFPYEVNDLAGRVRIEKDQVFVEKLTGRHGGAEVQVDARIDCRGRRAVVDVDVSGTHVALDNDLFAALGDRHKSLWQRFNPRGAAALTVHLERPEAQADGRGSEWQSHITAELDGAELSFTEYPYPLDRVEGRVNLDDDRVQFVGLTGHRESATVRIDGNATFPANEPATVELRLDADHVPLDRALADALPAEGRGAFEQFQPQGFIDLSGTIALRDPRQGVAYDLRAKVSDAAICYQQFPYRITEVNGEVALRPEGFSIINVSGRHEGAAVAARGDIRRAPDAAGYVADLDFDCQQLALKDDLFAALPPSLKTVWNLLKPQGTVHIETALHHVSAGEQVEQHHRTHITATRASMCFSGFPLPLTDVSGDVMITDRQVEIDSLSGRYGDGRIRLAGRIGLASPAMQGTLILDATDLQLSKPLLFAMPDGIRAALESCKVAGGFDLHLDPLQFDSNAEDQTRWAFAGKMQLRSTVADLGIEVGDATGVLAGHGAISFDGAISLDAQAQLDRISLGGWQLENFTSRIVKDAGVHRIDLRDAAADAYGGQATGVAKITLAGSRDAQPSLGDPSSQRSAPIPEATEYQVSIVTRDMQLGRYLASLGRPQTPASLPPGEKLPEGAKARGTIDGSLIVRGRTGPGAFREGSGEVFVRHAEVWRLPLVFLIFQVLNLAPDENVFHDGWMKFYLSGDTLTFHQIDLQGRALSFIGGGTMNTTDKRLDILLLARSPVRIRLPLLTDLLELFAREIMEVKVGGTLDKPTIRPQPLRTLSVVAKALFPPHPARSPGAPPVPPSNR